MVYQIRKKTLTIFVLASAVGLLTFMEHNIADATRIVSIGASSKMALSNITISNNSQSISSHNNTSFLAPGNNMTISSYKTQAPAITSANTNQTSLTSNNNASGNRTAATANTTKAGSVALCRRCHL